MPHLSNVRWQYTSCCKSLSVRKGHFNKNFVQRDFGSDILNNSFTWATRCLESRNHVRFVVFRAICWRRKSMQFRLKVIGHSSWYQAMKGGTEHNQSDNFQTCSTIHHISSPSTDLWPFFMFFIVFSCHFTILHDFFRSDLQQPRQVLPQHRFARDSADASGGFRRLSMGIGPGLRLSEAQEYFRNQEYFKNVIIRL